MTREVDLRPVPFLTGVRCDRCGRSAKQGDIGLENFVSFDFDAGCDSELEDGTHADLDLCHRCVLEVLGPWLQLSKSAWNGGPRRIGIAKGRNKQRQSDLNSFVEADLTVSEDFLRAGRNEPLPGEAHE